MRTSPIMQMVWFLVGFGIAAALVLLMGCSPAESTAGVMKHRIVVDPNTGLTDKVIIEEPVSRNCCMALIPSCMACAQGCDVETWLERTCGPNAIDAEYAGWNEETNEPIWLCQAIIIN